MKMQLTPKLKPLPCPFCGKQPDITPKKPTEYDNYGSVTCNCHCMLFTQADQTGKENKGAGYYIDLAIKKWNKRK